MSSFSEHSPVILLLENTASRDSDFVKRWLLESGFLTSEAVDAFQVLEQLSDFTVRERPDVFILNVQSPSGELSSIREIVGCASQEALPSIIAMSDITDVAGNDDFYAADLAQVKNRLEQLIPASNRVCAN